MDKVELSKNALKSLFRLTNLMIECRNVPIASEGGLVLYPAEQHFMCLMNENPDCNAKELAEMQGVTKGAVSQMVKKLEAKGMVNQVRSDFDRKSKNLRLTSSGRELCEEMDQKFVNRQDGFFRIWEQYDDSVIEQCAEIFTLMVDIYAEDLK